MKIKKRIIFSRHGIRYPIHGAELSKKLLGKDVINWEYPSGVLTDKGALIEFAAGQKLKEIIGDGYHDGNTHLYCNNMNRTNHTLQILSLAMHPFEENKINMRYDGISNFNPEFDLFLNEGTNIDDVFPKEELREQDKRLIPIYRKIEEVLELEEGIIDKMPTQYVLKENDFIQTLGALGFATLLADMFVLKYYEGFDQKEIFNSDNFIEDLKMISIAKDEFIDNIFTNDRVIKAAKENILEVMKRALESDDELNIIVGHDANIATILHVLGVKLHKNDNRIEKYTIGGKLLFTIYEDETYDLEYIYYNYMNIRVVNLKNIVREVLVTKKSTKGMFEI